MSLDELLSEINAPSDGERALNYYKWLGYKSGEEKPNSPARARAVQSLLTGPEPFIYRNDLIAGSMRPMKAVIDPAEADEANRVSNGYGERWFQTNADHFAPDYKTALTLGIPGLMRKIEDSAREHADESEKVSFLADMKTALTALRTMIGKYADAAEKLPEGYNPASCDIAANCRALTERAPGSFREALQFVWFCHLAFCYEGRYAMALGRMDQYLYPFYRADVEKGKLTKKRATELLSSCLIKIGENRSLFGFDDVVNICIGGTSPDGSSDVNELSYCILDAVNECHIPGPNLSARISKNAPDEFLDACLKVIGTGLGYPALMNDEVNVKALMRAGYPAEDAHNFCMVGCIENFITGSQPPWSDGRFDTPRYLEYTLHNGRGILDENARGIDTGAADEITGMDDLMSRLEKQLSFAVKNYVEGFNKTNHISNPMDYSSPLLSLFCRDCIARGLDINNGGALYPSVHGAALMGIGTMADSLAAIEKVVYTDKEASLSEVAEAMARNFDGCDDLRQKLLDAPKYGNNDDFADKYAVWFVEFLTHEFDRYRTNDGGRFYTLIAANVSNIYAGKLIAATPDGRLAGEPLSDAASPTYGKDTNGATSTLLSIVKPDYSCVSGGSVVNQKYSPSAFRDGRREKLRALLRVYFDKGGQEIQINSTSREVLKDAMKNPEKYRNLVVRVSGFSARYVTLAPEVQHDILNRTQHE